MKSEDTELQVLWFQSDPDLLESLIKHGLVIDSHKSLPIAQSPVLRPGEGRWGCWQRVQTHQGFCDTIAVGGAPVVSNLQKADSEFTHRRRPSSSVTFTGGIQTGRVCPRCPGRVSSALLCCQSHVLHFSLGKPCPVCVSDCRARMCRLEQGSGAVSSSPSPTRCLILQRGEAPPAQTCQVWGAAHLAGRETGNGSSCAGAVSPS